MPPAINRANHVDEYVRELNLLTIQVGTLDPKSPRPTSSQRIKHLEALLGQAGTVNEIKR